MRQIRIIAFIALFIVLLATGAAALDNQLGISGITVKVDGDRKSADESGGTIKVPPASTLDLKVTVENLFDKDVNDIKIKNVEVEAVLENIDDGDDMDETSDDKDISPGRDTTFNIEFNIPLRIDSDETFTLTVTATGKDENGTKHTAEVVFDVEADKENHELRFLKKEIYPSTVSCSRSSRLAIELINTGDNDENVELSIENQALDYMIEQDFEMVENIDDDDNEYEYSDVLNLADADPGTYDFLILAKYRDGREVLEDTLTLNIEECGSTKPTPEPEPKPEEPKTTTTTITPTAPTTTQPATTTVQQPVVQYVPQPQPTVTSTASNVKPSSSTAVATPRTSYVKNSWWDDNKWVVLIVVTDVILLIAGIAIVLAVLKRKRN